VTPAVYYSSYSLIFCFSCFSMTFYSWIWIWTWTPFWVPLCIDISLQEFVSDYSIDSVENVVALFHDHHQDHQHDYYRSIRLLLLDYHE